MIRRGPGKYLHSPSEIVLKVVGCHVFLPPQSKGITENTTESDMTDSRSSTMAKDPDDQYEDGPHSISRK